MSPHARCGLAQAWGAFTLLVVLVAVEGLPGGWQTASAEAGALAGPAADPEDHAFDPPWADVAPRRVITLARDVSLDDGANGERLVTALGALRPGDRLEIGGGTWRLHGRVELSVAAPAAAPVQVVAGPGARPVLVRDDTAHNGLEIGLSSPARHLALRGLTLTGGSMGLRLHDAADVWLDRLEIHHTAEAALVANTDDVDALTVTRCALHHTEGTGEGMYLGAHDGSHVLSRSVIARNHVHDTAGSQGDGIEIKPGSWGNLVVENLVHDTHWPAVLLYDAGGRAPNRVVRNVLLRSGAETLQVQAEAIVTDNLVVGGATALLVAEHTGPVHDLTIVHNTILDAGPAVRLGDLRPGADVVFANNLVASAEALALDLRGDASGATLAGNVVSGATRGLPEGAIVAGRGLADLRDASWDGGRRDVTPLPGSTPIGAADDRFATDHDLLGRPRTPPLAAGCRQPD